MQIGSDILKIGQSNVFGSPCI